MVLSLVQKRPATATPRRSTWPIPATPGNCAGFRSGWCRRCQDHDQSSDQDRGAHAGRHSAANKVVFGVALPIVGLVLLCFAVLGSRRVSCTQLIASAGRKSEILLHLVEVVVGLSPVLDRPPQIGATPPAIKAPAAKVPRRASAGRNAVEPFVAGLGGGFHLDVQATKPCRIRWRPRLDKAESRSGQARSGADRAPTSRCHRGNRAAFPLTESAEPGSSPSISRSPACQPISVASSSISTSASQVCPHPVRRRVVFDSLFVVKPARANQPRPTA